MLYDSEYSEYYFINKNWPEFNEKELNNVIKVFSDSKRNF
jgi:undecaprenyl pyrophosphate synthase